AARQQSGCCPHSAIDAPPQRVRPHAGAAGIGSERQKAVLGQYVAVSKGTMSEMELSLFRQRSLEALKQKARRGELFLTVAIGYLKTSHDRIEKDPDRRVQEAIMLAFNKFAELQTVRQVHLWMRQERLPLPATEYGPEGRKVVWKLPVYNTLHHLLTNPIYA